MNILSVNVFRAYPPRTPMDQIVRAEAAQGRYPNNDPRRAGVFRRRSSTPPPAAA